MLEQLQAELERSPTSRVFAPLADGYLKLGQVESALRVAQLGVLANPDFATGRVVLGRVLMESQRFNDALIHLLEAVRLAPDHRMAQLTLGELYLLRREPREALNAFKMALLLNPNDQRALDAVRRWEFLTAGEFSEEVFERLEPEWRRAPAETAAAPEQRRREIERALSLADAWTIRHDPERAIQTLRTAIKSLGPDSDLEERARLLESRYQIEPEPEPEITDVLPRPQSPPPQTAAKALGPSPLQRRRERLQEILARIQRHRRKVDPTPGFQDSGGSLS